MSTLEPTRTPASRSIPVVCTLGPTDRSDQEQEWVDLQALALSTERIDGGVTSTFPLQLAARVEDLARREEACCNWLACTVDRTPDGVRLRVTTTASEGVAVIEHLAGLR